METYNDAPQELRNFLSYHETVKGQSRRTVSEYYLDLRMFLRFVRLMREELPYKTPLDDIPIKDLGLDFIRSITTSEVFDFLSYLANDRENPEAAGSDTGIGSAARARKLSAIWRSWACVSASSLAARCWASHSMLPMRLRNST